MGTLQEITFHEWTFEHEFPASFSIQAPAVKKKYLVASPHSGKCHSIQFAFDEILISCAKIEIHEPVRLQREIEGEGIEMLFVLKGKSIVTRNNIEQHTFSEKQHNLYYGCDDAIELQATDGKLELVAIHLSKAYYLRLLHQSNMLQQQFIHKITHNDYGFMRAQNFAITPAMHLVIEEIKHCQKKAMVKRIFLEAKVLELLMLQTEQIEQEERQKGEDTLKANDLLLLTEAKRILEENMIKPPTIHKLSKLVGMNESHLKRRFKATFGTTIFGYVHQLKMQQARHLLTEKNKSVSETAYEVGYQNPQHFTAAFKKYYHILPSELKK